MPTTTERRDSGSSSDASSTSSGLRAPYCEMFSLDFDKTMFAQLDPDEMTGTPCDLTDLDNLLNLDNNIHPIFARSNWPNPDIQHDALAPALRLATLLLTNPFLLHYSHAVLVGEVKRISQTGRSKTSKEGGSRDQNIVLTNEEEAKVLHEHRVFLGTSGRPYSHEVFSRKATDLSDRDVRDVHDKLAELAPQVKFKVVKLSDGFQGHTLSEEPLDPPIQGFVGNRSTIYLEDYENMYRWMCDFHEAVKADPKKQPTEVELGRQLVAVFTIANLLCHELAHAMVIARLGTSMLVGFDGQDVSEDGYNWTSCVFGGTPEVWFNHNLITLEPWPSPAHFDSCVRMNCALGIRQVPTDEVEMRWILPLSFLRNLSDKAFWKEVVPRKGLEAFRPEKVLGYRKTPGAARGECECRKCLEDAAKVEAFSSGDLERFRALVPHDRKKNEPEETCSRLGWDLWPYGCEGVRFHAQTQGRDVHTYGVPNGYDCLLDGTIVAERFAKPVKAVELAHLEENAQKAERTFARLYVAPEGETEEESLRREDVRYALQQMLRPDEDVSDRQALLRKRSVVGVKEVWDEDIAIYTDEEMKMIREEGARFRKRKRTADRPVKRRRLE